jgi:N-acetylneuraminic acid mutarotase
MGRWGPWAVVIALSAAALGAREGPAAGGPLTDVYQAGDAGYHTFRIPALIAARNGTLLAFAEGRRAGGGDAGDIDLVVKRSRDGGRTWSALQVIGDNGPDTFGNPCPVVDRGTGTIWLLSTHNRGVDREKDILAGTSGGTRTVWAMTSTDDGETWSSAVEITASVKRPAWTWYATGPGVGIQTRDGRLVIPANHAEAGTGVHRSHIVYSDDGGRHWSIGGIAEAGTNESQIAELSDGRLMLNMRNHPPKPANFRMVAISADGGRTLAPARPDLRLLEPPAQASLLALSGGQRRSLVFANPASTARERLTVRLSDDDGATWPASRIVHQGPAAYSSLSVLADGSVAVLFERGERSPYERITLARLPLAWLRNGRDERVVPATTALPDLPDAHGLAGAYAGVHDGRLLAAGGANFPGAMPWNGGAKVWHDRVFALDLRARNAGWRDAGRLPAALAYGVSLTVPEGVLLIGGGNAERHVADVRLMTLDRGGRLAFRELPSLPAPLAQMAGALVGRHVHVAGGIETPDATAASAGHWRLDLDATDRGWQPLAPLPAAGRILPTAAAIDGAFYLVGGCSLAADAVGRPARTYLREAWRFSAGAWTRLPDLPRAATGAASPAPVADGSLFVVSGDDGPRIAVAPADHPGFTGEILRYDPTPDTWSRAGALNMPAPVTLPTVPWQDGFILVSGEVRPGVRTRQVLKFSQVGQAGR